MNVVTSTPPKPPSCFGTDWDSKEPECAGGPHPTRRNPRTGSHVLDACDWYLSCGARTNASKNASGTLIPVQNLFRTPNAPTNTTPPVTPAMPQPTTFGQWIQGQRPGGAPVVHPGVPTATMPQPSAPAQPQQQVHFAPGTVHPAQTWQLNYTSPPFLSTPETLQPGESIWKLLLREVLRAMGKGAGHAIAHFFDTRALK